MSTALITKPLPPIRVQVPAGCDGITVGQLVDLFIASKRKRAHDGELSIKTVEDYDYAARLLIEAVGADVPAAAIKPLHFTALRTRIAGKRGLRGEAKTIVCIRALFNYAYKQDLLANPPKFGVDFGRPPAKLFRKAKCENGSMMLEAEQIRAVLDIAEPKMRAMILVCANCAFGPTDLGNLKFENLDLKEGWIRLPRQKTWIDRRCPLWPETVEALSIWLQRRRPPMKPENADYVFLTYWGNRVCNPRSKFVMSYALKSLFRKAGATKRYLGIYGLRRMFETIGGESLDQVGVNYLMGHAPASGDMAAAYRQRISDERLQRIVDHVRHWLWPKLPLTQVEQRQIDAELVAELWEKKERLTGPDVLAAIKALRINQTELANGVGYCLDWVNKLILGKNAISDEADKRFRRFFEQRSGRLKQLERLVQEGGAH